MDFLSFLSDYEQEDVSNVKSILEANKKKERVIFEKAFDGMYTNKKEAILNVEHYFTSKKTAPKGIDVNYVKENLQSIVNKINTLSEGDIKIIIHNDVDKNGGGRGATASVICDDPDELDEGKKKKKRGRPPKKQVGGPVEDDPPAPDVMAEDVETSDDVFYIKWSSIFDNPKNKYDVKKFSDVLKKKGAKVWSDNEGGESNQPEVVVFKGISKAEAETELEKLPVFGNGVIINEPDWEISESVEEYEDLEEAETKIDEEEEIEECGSKIKEDEDFVNIYDVETSEEEIDDEPTVTLKWSEIEDKIEDLILKTLTGTDPSEEEATDEITDEVDGEIDPAISQEIDGLVEELNQFGLSDDDLKNVISIAKDKIDVKDEKLSKAAKIISQLTALGANNISSFKNLEK